jgi:hypothetical protein
MDPRAFLQKSWILHEMADEVDSPRKIAEQASRFLVANERLRRDDTMNEKTLTVFGLPALVLSAFSCELFLKCILKIDGQRVPPSHDLFTLFKRLREERQKRITAMWDAGSARRALSVRFAASELGLFKPQDLESSLKMSRNAFAQLRYIYEDRESKASYVLEDLPRILFVYIREMRPEWWG